MVFAPRVDGLDKLEPPAGFLAEFNALASKVYPQDTIAKLRNGYNPVIVGYIHDGNSFSKITAKFREIAASASRPLKVVLEIAPERLGWIEEFLRDEKEYKERGTVWGKKPTEDMVSALRSYRPKLRHLALWLLENGFEVVPIEHESVVDWINSDRRRMSDSDEELWSGGLSELQPGYTAIRRDIHGLGVIERERPDIISVGLYHALKYELLLGRDGTNSFYFVSGNFSWSTTLKMWKQVHALYLQEQPLSK